MPGRVESRASAFLYARTASGYFPSLENTTPRLAKAAASRGFFWTAACHCRSASLSCALAAFWPAVDEEERLEPEVCAGAAAAVRNSASSEKSLPIVFNPSKFGVGSRSQYAQKTAAECV